MLTRLKVSGFKNLVDVDIRFGAFTCIAGVNGVGKSNLFDAIRFLSALAEYPLKEAALLDRDKNNKTGDIRHLFHRVGNRYVEKMSFEVEIIIPIEDHNDVGQLIKTQATFLTYSLELAYKAKDSIRALVPLKIIKEKLTTVKAQDIENKLCFKHTYNTWSKSLFNLDSHLSCELISTEIEDNTKWIKINPNNNNCKKFRSQDLSRTALSIDILGGDSAIFLARQEMISWKLFQLEPSSLRQSNEFTNPVKLGTNGANLAVNLYYLAGKDYTNSEIKSSEKEIETKVYSQVSNRLSELLDDIDEVWIDRDDARQLLTLMVKNRDGTIHPARSLSDGTMRFLALVTLELDPESLRLLCLEEPENGIHPERIETMLRLLQDIAVDTEEAVDINNPLRQVIINTHSPIVVQQVPEDSLVFAELKETVLDSKRFKRASFSYLPDTWRDKDSSNDKKKTNIISKGELLSYINPVSSDSDLDRVIDRSDLKPFISKS